MVGNGDLTFRLVKSDSRSHEQTSVGNRLDDPQCLNSASIITTLISALPIPRASVSAPEKPIPALPFTMYSLLTAATCWVTRIMNFKAQLGAAVAASKANNNQQQTQPQIAPSSVPTYEIQQFVVLISTCERLAAVNGRAHRTVSLLKEFLSTSDLIPYMVGIVDRDGRPVLATLGLPLNASVRGCNPNNAPLPQQQPEQQQSQPQPQQQQQQQQTNGLVTNTNTLNIPPVLNNLQSGAHPPPPPPNIVYLSRGMPPNQNNMYFATSAPNHPISQSSQQHQQLPLGSPSVSLFGGFTLGPIAANPVVYPMNIAGSAINNPSGNGVAPFAPSGLGLALQPANIGDTFGDLVSGDSRENPFYGLWESQDPFDLPF